MTVTTIGIIGYGAFGSFIHELLAQHAPDITVRVHSSRKEVDNTTFFSLEDAAATDAVLLCGAISDFAHQLQSVMPHVRPDTIVIDVSTVKKYTSDCLRAQVGKQHFIATHPMFGPESYRKRGESLAGLRLVITDYVLTNDEFIQFKQILAAVGIEVIEMDPDTHDRMLAESLFLTHLIAQTVTMAGFARTQIDTISFGFLMDAVESVVHDRQLFQDVYRFNPYCKAVLKQYDAAEERVITTLLEVEDETR